MGAHNTFIWFLGTYGWIPFMLMIFFFINAFYNSFKQFLTSESKYKYLAPLMLITFITLSMAEDMNYKLSMIVSFSLAGIYMEHRKVRFPK